MMGRNRQIGLILLLVAGGILGWYYFTFLSPDWELTLWGEVVDARTGQPLPGVSINVGDLEVFTDQDGAFSLTIYDDSEPLIVSLDGYESETHPIDYEDEGYAIRLTREREEPDSPTETTPLQAVNDWLYQLDQIDIEAIGETKFDLVVMDFSAFDGTEDNRFTRDDISDLKNSPGGPKIVLAYMSIGEAEFYRWYWQEAWDSDEDGIPDAGAPSWLGPTNPWYFGNYKVRYWEEEWQAIIYGSDDSYLDKIITVGFDGVYLDIVEAYWYWGPEGESGLERESSAEEMVDFVISIADYAREVMGVEDFLVFPQNAEALAEYPDYVEVVSGIGMEDTWYDGDDPQPDSHIEETLEYLEVFKDAGKLVLVVDYVTEPDLIEDFYYLAELYDFIPYSTVRELDAITINPGHIPD